jgi:serine phosphatase RsbU (regulator of sigma subunit)
MRHILLFIFLSGLLPSFGKSLPQAIPVRQEIREMKRKGLEKDSVPSVKLLYDFRWTVTVKKKTGKIIRYPWCIPDTLVFGKDDLVSMETDLAINPVLLNKIYVLYYNVKGSALIFINGKKMLATGYFETGEPEKVQNKMEGFQDILIRDSVLHFKVVYFPKLFHADFINDLKLGETAWRDEYLKDKRNEELRSYSAGAFHIAFAFIFMIIFLFFKAGRENFYFSLYAFTVGIYCICQDMTLTPFLDVFLVFLWVIAFELLSIFLASVVLNKKKSHWLLAGIFIISFAFSFYFSESEDFNVGNAVFFGLLIALMLIFEIISMLYYLIQGFSHKRWEAKFITWGFFTGVLLILSLFVISFLFSYTYDKRYLILITYTPYLALVTVLVTMSIVLGRRNGENQSKLLAQLKEIETLSIENLAREKEKKQLLENQNIELERKVGERTREVLHQKEIIEIKNTEIMDNLKYAKRIQSAILPDEHVIARTFPDFFVCYLPRDIVSGDFYAFTLRGNHALVAVADCTGHGVSGAFMSMIGSSLFNQVVNERNVTAPAQVLEELNREVIYSLKQRYSDSNDGMDMAVINVNIAGKKLDFAGANRPLWIIRNNELIEYKPDKVPIGGLQFTENESFTNHSIALQEGDAIYLSTDGFADQFGGKRGKKMMTKTMKEVLLSIQNQKMAEQGKYLLEFFNHWKATEDQVDDVLVMGIRI